MLGDTKQFWFADGHMRVFLDKQIDFGIHMIFCNILPFCICVPSKPVTME